MSINALSLITAMGNKPWVMLDCVIPPYGSADLGDPIPVTMSIYSDHGALRSAIKDLEGLGESYAWVAMHIQDEYGHCTFDGDHSKDGRGISVSIMDMLKLKAVRWLEYQMSTPSMDIEVKKPSTIVE